MNLSRSLARLAAGDGLLRRLTVTTPAAAASFSTRTYKRSPLSDKPAAAGAAGVADIAKPELRRPSEMPFQPKVANSVSLIGTIGMPVELQSSPSSDNDEYSATSVLVHEKSADLPSFWIPIVFKGDLAQIAVSYLRENDLVYVIGQVSGDAPDLSIKDVQTNIQVLVHSLSFVQKRVHQKEEKDVSEARPAPSCSAAILEENNSFQHLWDDLLANPHKWWDNRSSKRSPTSADFKHKDTGEVLYVNQHTPEEVMSKLDSLFSQSTSSNSTKNSTPRKSTIKSTSNLRLWTCLVDNSQEWMDNRADKLNGLVSAKFPDFKHKVSSEALWLDQAPEWVLLKLDRLKFAEVLNIKKKDKLINNAGKAVSTISSKECETGSTSRGFRRTTPSTSRKNGENDELWKKLIEDPKKWWDNRSKKLNPNSPDFKHKDSGEALWLSPSTPLWVLQKLPRLKEKQQN